MNKSFTVSLRLNKPNIFDKLQVLINERKAKYQNVSYSVHIIFTRTYYLMIFSVSVDPYNLQRNYIFT